jgi:arginine-tRNA-protein transferase
MRLMLGTEHECGYLPGRRARSAFIDPGVSLDASRYGGLLDQGFRRSGGFVYRPLCLSCKECRAVRIDVAAFRPNRSQRRCLAANFATTLHIVTRLSEEHFDLYRRYLKARHPDGGMDPDDGNAFQEFLGCPWGRAEFWEFRRENRLVALAVVDRVPAGLSAVYTFFDPDPPDRSLGTLAVLEQIACARREGRPYVYLGYWVEGSRTMHYKRNFAALEILGNNGWVALTAEQTAAASPACG